jgi:hypothetical protein
MPIMRSASQTSTGLGLKTIVNAPRKNLKVKTVTADIYEMEKDEAQQMTYCDQHNYAKAIHKACSN